MYERMLNKSAVPTEEEIKNYIGENSVAYISAIKESLEKVYDLSIELRFPFGNNYGWGYKFSAKSKHLFYLFFEKESITIMLQISKIKTEKELQKYADLSEEGKQYWENRYPCGTSSGGEKGGWIHYRVTGETSIARSQLKDIGIFLSLRTHKEIEIMM